MVDLDPQLLRSFVAVADDLHFTRAAVRLHLTQQAVSRHVRRLEHDVGVALFDRTTRQIELTAAGKRLLPGARHLLRLHDQLVLDTRGTNRPLLVDTIAHGLTPSVVLQHARAAEPTAVFRARFSGGAGAAIAELLAGRLDIAFGRVEGTGVDVDGARLARRVVRLEPLSLLLADDHPLAARPTITGDQLAGMEIDISAETDSLPNGPISAADSSSWSERRRRRSTTMPSARSRLPSTFARTVVRSLR